MSHSEPTLVTGGCGFVGRNLVRRLLEDGRTVHVVDDLSTGRNPRSWLPESEVDASTDDHLTLSAFNGTLHFFNEDVRAFMDRRPPEEYGDVFHLAAVVGGRTTIQGQPLTVATDLSIDADFFNWVATYRPARVLYASSSAAYPTHLQNQTSPVKLREEYLRFDEDVGVPDMTYGWAKLTGEYLAQFAAQNYGVPVGIVRPFSGYGEDQDFDYPVPSIARRVYRREDPLQVWGSGRQVRDFVHIDDCVEAMLRLVDRVENVTTVNIGTGKPTNFLEVAETFARITGYEPDIVNLPDKPEGPRYRCADTSHMESMLEWTPSISLEEGFSRVLDGMETRVG